MRLNHEAGSQRFARVRFAVSTIKLAMIAFAACVIGVQGACAGNGASDKPDLPTGPDTTTPPPVPTVDRSVFTVHVDFDPADSSLARMAGVASSGLTVRITRLLTTDPDRSAITDANGTVRFDSIPIGQYQVNVYRALSPAEMGRLNAADNDATMFGAGASVRVTSAVMGATLNLVASRRGSLLISEIFAFNAQIPAIGSNDHYTEVYNNSDTTIYLDGLQLFRTSTSLHAPGSSQICERNAAHRNDANAVWATWIRAFPGDGHQYPIKPGEAKLIATDAINHTLMDPQAPDLSRAAFEDIGDSTDLNSSSAGDLVVITPPRKLPGYHGEPISLPSALGIALPVAKSLPQFTVDSEYSTPTIVYPTYRIPRAAVLDLAGVDYTRTTSATFGKSWCAPFLNPVFERADAEILDFTARAASRRSLGFTPSGAEILQRTHSASRDFVLGTPLLRSINK